MEIPVTSIPAMFSQAAFGVGLASPAGDWQLVNDRFCEIVGHSREELLASSYRDITHPEMLCTMTFGSRSLESLG
jgi:PAS domain S-box-containing protein